MGFRINTNVASISAQRTLKITGKASTENYSKLSSGTRIAKAADDAAGLAISEKTRASIRSANQAVRNSNDGISLVQVAEGGLNEVQSILVRLRELSMQSATDTVSDEQRTFIGFEYKNLQDEVERIANVTEFNGKKLLNGEGDSYEFQVGINNVDGQDRITYNSQVTNATATNLGIRELDPLTKTTARESLNVLDDAISKVSGQRAELGAIQNRLGSTVNNLEVLSENLNAANSRIRDTDFAEATAESTRLGILSQAGTSVLAQANQNNMLALKLIG